MRVDLMGQQAPETLRWTAARPDTPEMASRGSAGFLLAGSWQGGIPGSPGSAGPVQPPWTASRTDAPGTADAPGPVCRVAGAGMDGRPRFPFPAVPPRGRSRFRPKDLPILAETPRGWTRGGNRERQPLRGLPALAGYSHPRGTPAPADENHGGHEHDGDPRSRHGRRAGGERGERSPGAGLDDRDHGAVSVPGLRGRPAPPCRDRAPGRGIRLHLTGRGSTAARMFNGLDCAAFVLEYGTCARNPGTPGTCCSAR